MWLFEASENPNIQTNKNKREVDFHAQKIFPFKETFRKIVFLYFEVSQFACEGPYQTKPCLTTTNTQTPTIVPLAQGRLQQRALRGGTAELYWISFYMLAEYESEGSVYVSRRTKHEGCGNRLQYTGNIVIFSRVSGRGKANQERQKRDCIFCSNFHVSSAQRVCRKTLNHHFQIQNLGSKHLKTFQNVRPKSIV